MTPLQVAPLEEQDPLESHRAWAKVAQGIAAGDMDLVGSEKTKIEVSQRELRQQEKNEGRVWNRRYFTAVESCPTLESLGAIVGVNPEADKTGGIWRFDEQKEAAAATAGAQGGIPVQGGAPAEGNVPVQGDVPVQANNISPESAHIQGSAPELK